MVAFVNISEIPQTSETMILSVGLIFGAAFIGIIAWTFYQYLK
jgi:hypothetical protein